MNRILIKKILHEGLMLPYKKTPTYQEVYNELFDFLNRFSIDSAHGTFYTVDEDNIQTVEIQYDDWDLGYEHVLEMKIYWSISEPNIISIETGFYKTDEDIIELEWEYSDILLDEMDIRRIYELSNDLMTYIRVVFIPNVIKQIEYRPNF